MSGKEREQSERLEVAYTGPTDPDEKKAEELDTTRAVTAFQAGDQQAFATLYTRYFHRVFSYMRAVLKDQHEAEDAAQQVFLQAFEALPAYQPRSPFQAWLFRIVRNHAIDLLRKAGRLEVTDPAELDRRRDREAPEADKLAVLNWIKDGELLLFVERLSLPQRQALMLRFLFDLDNAEIAEIMGRTRSDVRKLQHRAIRFLEKRLAAIGREAKPGDLVRMRRWGKQAPVLRHRRNALRPNGPNRRH